MPDAKLTPVEQEKAAILVSAINGRITNAHAAKQLHLSIRQVQRAKAALRKNGVPSVVHGLKGKTGNHRIAATIKEKSLSVIKEKYPDFKPSFATEKLSENHSISISYGTTRLWMIQENLWKPRKQKHHTYRSWRPRKEYYGELQQFDGSYHLWFEDRYGNSDGTPFEVCLLASVDDATGIITKASFAANEGVSAVFTFWKEYLMEHGKPLGIYLDKFSTYKINHKSAVDNHELMTQFGRAMQDVAITLITAHSPQAKGRIERLFGTLQDRLVKEMRLAKITTPEEGNRFLTKIFLPRFNQQFAVKPLKEGNVHRVLTVTDRENLSRIFSVQSTRTIHNDFTIQFKNTWYQLAEIQPTTVRAKEKVLVEQWLDGTVHFSVRGNYLNFIVLPERPIKVSRPPVILARHRLIWKPPVNHPWRKPYDVRL